MKQNMTDFVGKITLSNFMKNVLIFTRSLGDLAKNAQT